MPPTSVPGPPAPRQPPPGHPSAPLELLGVISATVPHERRAGSRTARYTVAARFSRSASAWERALIEHPRVQLMLAEHGYGSVRLKVLDRRLLIENTNVEMLERGLAAAIVDVLAAVDREVAAGRARSLREAQQRRAAQAQRSAVGE